MDQQKDSHKATESNGLVPGPRGGMLRHFQKGVASNPGGVPKGKRISTWMAEFGDKPPSKWPTKAQLEKMPANASIALARLDKARKADGIRDTELILDRTEGAVVAEPSAPMLSQIAAAILALKAAGVEIRRPIDAQLVDPLPLTPPKTEEEDDERSAKRFRRGRA